MRPPNIKRWAERVHTIQQGKGEQGKQVAGEKEQTNVIGNEGPSFKREWLYRLIIQSVLL